MATTLKKSDFPESVHGLLDKSKTDLLNIISRKDDVETRLNKENSEMKKKIEELNSTIIEQSGVITKQDKLINELNTQIDVANETIHHIGEEHMKTHKNFLNCFISLIIVTICLIIALVKIYGC